MGTHNLESEIAASARSLSPWAAVLFWAGMVGVAAIVAGAAFSAADKFAGWPAILAALHASGLELLLLSPGIALLSGLWAAQKFLGVVSRGNAVDGATLTVLREIGDCCVWAGALTILVVPNLRIWIEGEGGFSVRPEPAFLALVGLGLLMGLIARVFARNVQRATVAQAELDQIV